MPGKVLLDDAFTEERLQDSLGLNYSVVHIASHFELAPKNDSASFLLLGDGTHLTLERLALIPNLFANVDLLTLSACNTGMGGKNPLRTRDKRSGNHLCGRPGHDDPSSGREGQGDRRAAHHLGLDPSADVRPVGA
jgi:CHAT domain-containing protein